MIGEMTLSQAAIAFGGTLLFPDCHFTSVSTDTRTLGDGELFVALRGANFDGHGFLEAAALRACGLVVDEPDKRLHRPQWVVADTTVALGQLAQLNRERFGGTLVALTGSTGKTTVKEMIAAILTQVGPTHATRGNLNNHIGVPRTVLEIDDRHRFAVIEMGASGPGEIDYLCRIARPDVALVNNVMAAHIEGFGSEAVIADTKGAVYTRLSPEGLAVVNLDDHWAQKWLAMAGRARTLTYSLAGRSGDLGAEDIETLGGEGSRFLLRIGTRTRSVQLALPGSHNIANALAAAACAHGAGASLDHIAAGLAAVTPVKGRMQALAGRRGSKVLDDTYNANPGSVRAAIDVLAARPGHRILVLGDMAELGSMATKGHRDIGLYAREQGVDKLYVTGRYAEHTARGFGETTEIFPDRESLAAALLGTLDATTTVLVKGSRSAAMEQVVALITEENGDAAVAG